MKQVINIFFILLILNCSKSNLEKINSWLENEEYEKLLEFSNKNKANLSDEEIYLSSVGISKFQSFLRKHKSEQKYSDKKYIKNLENKTGLKVISIHVENDNLIVIEDNYHKLLNQSKYYKDKSILDKFKYTSITNEISENSFLLTDILEIDPRLFMHDFQMIWIESMKLGLPASLNDEGRNKFIQILHFLASKEETNLKNQFYFTEGKNVNLRSGPGTENVTIAKLNNEEVFQIDSDYNTTSIGNKTGKWIQIYVFSSDITGWIFSPFLKPSKLDFTIAKKFEDTLLEKTKFKTIDFNNWDPKEIPNQFYGNYISTKKEILDANVGFTVYTSEIEQGICTKLEKDTKKIELSFAEQDSSNRILIFNLKAVEHSKSKTLTKIEIQNHRLYLNSKELVTDIENNKLQKFELKINYIAGSEISFSLSINSGTKEIFQHVHQNKENIDSWELCIPQGKKTSSSILIFAFNIY